MNFLLLGGFVNGMLGFLMAFLSLFLIMLILIQRGKGGGLTGALGGPGGQSAFGSKAGDTFTVVTVVVASIWGFTCAFAMWLNVESGGDVSDPDQTAAVQAAGDDELGAGAEADAGADTTINTDLTPGLSQGGELVSPSITGPAETAKPADAPAETAKPADAPAETAKPADAPAETAKPADAPAETAKPADAPAETAKPADAPAETDSGEAADAKDNN
ncbi:MAG: preprotein translocase subunit SecG [Saprospirales bacterium TMED214]|nr:MAG: preprotein translocase subunit SecG [Saprospirales bacterium TMED214]